MGLSKRGRKAPDACILCACSLPAPDEWPKWELLLSFTDFPVAGMKAAIVTKVATRVAPNDGVGAF